MEAWHWVSADRMTRFEPRVPIVAGETLRVDPPVEMCNHGLHASVRALDALQYAPGPIICRVRLSGEIVQGDDKLVASERTVLWMYDASAVLHEFACCVAEAALLFADVTNDAFWQAIEDKRAWLRGEIDDAQLAVSWAAARVAARDAACAAVRDAAWAAAWATAWVAAEDATYAAAESEQNDLFEGMLYEGREHARGI